VKILRLPRFVLALTLTAFLASAFFIPSYAHAQSAATDGLETVGDSTGLGSEDPRIIVANIIRIGLTLLGVVAVVIVLYGGFTWMTAGGDEEKVSRAKRILVNGGIGLVIILLSWTITTFIISALVNATGGGGGNGGGNGGGGAGGSLGGGSSAAFTTTAFIPSGDVAIRNVLLRVTFSKNIDSTTKDGNIIVKNAQNGAVVAGVSSVSGNALTFRPSTPCPEPNGDRFCFDADTSYTVEVKTALKSTSGGALECSSAAPCTSTFKTGDLIDTEAPRAELVSPDDGSSVSVDSLIGVQASATDDAAVSSAAFSAGGTLFDTVPATGGDLKDVLITSDWDTAGLTLGDRYKVTTVVSDIAGNTDEDSVTVRVRPATCFNGITDESAGETGPDCGGDTSGANYCGACGGSSCSEDADCGGGASCSSGSCVSLPIINGVSPESGAVGTFVTLSGSHFGATGGKVFFTNASGTGEVEATIPVCADGWSTTEVTVEVPAGAGDGPLRVLTFDGKTDSTNDDKGELILDFDVNTVVHPNICSLSPRSGTSGGAVAATGQNFGSTQGASLVHFGATQTASSYASWSNTGITSTVPVLSNGKYNVFVTVDGVESNALVYAVTSYAVSTPSISAISPSAGGVGRYVSLDGADFGDSVGIVKLTNKETGAEAIGSLDFPAECSTADNWRSAHVLFAVPTDFSGGGKLTPGAYDVTLETSGGAESNTVPFTVLSEDVGPNLCALTPDSGSSGDAVSLYGNGFGESTGNVSFFSSQAATVSSWTDKKVSVVVPAGAETGKVVLTDSTGVSANDGYFLKEDGEEGSVRASAAAYSWSFSTGAVPAVPQVISECSDTRISAVPDAKFTDAVCVNASVYAEFTVDMNEATLADAVSVEACTGSGTNPCSSVEKVGGSIATHARSFLFTADTALKPSTMYRVTVSATAASVDGTTLSKPVQWTFTTRADSGLCSIEEVRVSPSAATISSANATQGFTALPVSGCVVTDADAYSWDWSIDESYARFTSSADSSCVGGSTSCATAEALAEGMTPVTAKESGSAIEGSGDLTINFIDPYVVSVWPACDVACSNAEVGGSFNTNMSRASVEASGAVTLYECANELCTSLTEIVGAHASCTGAATGECKSFSFSGITLTPSRYYRVVLSGSLESASGVKLTRTNYGGDYSWTFRAREDGTACSVSRIAVSPSESTLQSVGEKSAFTAEAFGSADSCSVSGQRLSGFDYSWNWTTPIEDKDIDSDPSTRLAEWYGATLTDTGFASLPEGCTSSCMSAGSGAYAAICGDGTLDKKNGEECEDGNVANGDGCSASCLREGANSFGTCGNGTVERSAAGAGEDCDDKNLIDGDGCSSTCLAEGSRAVGATCGNNDVAADTVTESGEECDDGNALNGDGCSSACVNEGTPTLASIGGAVCGDSHVDAPAENCDDGNGTDDDGCSSACLLEGSSRSYGSVCGDGTLGKGEECEDANTTSGDGCSSSCLLEGSSVAYASPSFCGDGLVGKGEVAMCEAGAHGDGKIDPLQVAVIREDGVFEVDPDTKEGRATIEVGESSSGFSTTADLTLMCAATKDADCKNPSAYGVGTGSCCVPRPVVTLSPAAGADVCRNAALYGVFTTSMDTGTFSYSATEAGSSVTKYRMYAKLDLTTTAGNCPATHTTLAQGPHNIFVRAWNAIIRLVTGNVVNASTGDCVVPIDSYEQVAQDDGTYKVYMHYGALLQAGGKYTLVVEGDSTLTDESTDGVRSLSGTGLNGDAATSFTVGSEICALDAVNVDDTSKSSPNTFTRGDESHTFAASGLSYRGGTTQEIESIPGEYAWSITSWTSADKDLFTAERDSTDPSSAAVATLGVNGETSIVATATISEDKEGVSAGDTVEGSGDALAFLCENPWPPLSSFPWSDTAEGAVSGLASEGVGWTNFSTYYCRDSAADGAGDDLPSAAVVRPEVSKTPNVIKEYLFEMGDGSGDAVGVRVISNPEYLSAKAWYDAQGFSGNPSVASVDGFSAVSDDRTTYVVAPNLTAKNTLYPNIYVISVNEGASETTKSIAAEMMQNMSFGVNIPDVTLCVESDGVTTTDETCSSNLDCNSGETCGSVKAKIRRDTRRLTDLTDLRSAVEKYGQDNGECSLTKSKFCSLDSDCPSGESCVGIVPPLASGTYVRGLASSVWSSWTSLLGGALESDALAVDPLNVYSSCGAEGGAYASYDAQTCVDQARGVYACPADSYAYHYRTQGAEAATLYADLEYSGADWNNDIADADSAIDISIGNSSGYASGFETAAFCSGASFGSSSSCGDGVVGASEVCEIGQSGGTGTSCSAADGTAGTKSQICNTTCNGFVDNPAAVCVAASCGNGVVDSTETCDDGSLNGTYGYCGSTCTYDSAFYCGDGELAGGESCDCGNSSSTLTSSSRAYGAGSGTCAAINGTYNSSPNASCSWDCRAPAGYCGNGTVESGEQCDGADDTYSGKLCSAGKIGEKCTTDSDCGKTGGRCGAPAGIFGKFTKNAYEACAVGQTRVRSCDDTVGTSPSCTYDSTWLSAKCTDIGSCGDGVVDPDEACDDGNTDSSDSCTSSCTVNVCGDGAIYAGVEECDEGTDNGGSCSSSYGSTCAACSVSCRKVVSSGEFCGDGKRNGAEYCDASDIPYTYYDVGTGTTFGNCSVLGATTTSGKITYTCRDLGVCNGGARNGEYCTGSSMSKSETDEAICGVGSSCVKPTCSSSCTASCPFTYSTPSLLLTSNQPGARASSSVLLNSYSSSTSSVLPNAATLTVPACKAVTDFAGTISLSAVSYPEIYTVFVLDRSDSMKTALGSGTRISVAKDVLSDAVSSLYDELGDKMHIGLVGFSNFAGTGLCPNSTVGSCTNDSDCTETVKGVKTTYTCEDKLDFMPETDEAAALARISNYVTESGTQTDDGFKAAKTLLDSIPDGDNVRKIIVLLSDGAPSGSTGVADATKASDGLKAADYEVYTVALTTDATLKTNMKKWSSNSSSVSYAYNADNGIDYAYDGSTAEQLADVYESIVDSIVGVTLSFVTSDGTTTSLSTATLVEGVDQALPWPSNFKCDSTKEQSIPVQISFEGTGEIELSNVKVSYCAP
jgi:cysteine-rich repeat protein